MPQHNRGARRTQEGYRAFHEVVDRDAVMLGLGYSLLGKSDDSYKTDGAGQRPKKLKSLPFGCHVGELPLITDAEKRLVDLEMDFIERQCIAQGKPFIRAVYEELLNGTSLYEHINPDSVLGWAVPRLS